MIRAFDLDEVLAEFNAPFCKLITDQTGIVLPPVGPAYPTVWDYHLAVGLTPAQVDNLWKHVKETDFYETVKPLPDAPAALAMIRTCRSNGDAVYFITSRPGDYAKHLTEFWLDALGYECPTVLIASKKGPVCQGLGVNLFVDDKPENCWEVAAACPKAQVFLLDAPYNRGTDATWCEHNNITRIHSILDPRIYAQELAVAA